ncbi:hypothetical protein LOK49_LG03G00963 [Camellia lanceoleosa]|uniref:Uncharacterized protein n=1 Tax=Camellia lanceoleosa TaxID=1840588 RepID=A0ACC0IG04_9ERIC|nr:hypothetical protein LOK49_LG03G00963 [Camellia lanceoleosa]
MHLSSKEPTSLPLHFPNDPLDIFSPIWVHQVVEFALALQKSGCFSIVLKCVLAPVATAATSALRIPIIGIGTGPFCIGQVN